MKNRAFIDVEAGHYIAWGYQAGPGGGAAVSRVSLGKSTELLVDFKAELERKGYYVTATSEAEKWESLR